MGISISMGNTYLKCDNNKIVNERHIRWVKKLDEAMEVCCKENGCISETDFVYLKDTITVSKQKSPDSYRKLLELFND